MSLPDKVIRQNDKDPAGSHFSCRRSRYLFGCMLRGDSLLRMVMEKMDGKKTKGRSRQMMLDWMVAEG